MKILKDILTETHDGITKYSQGRVYLFISFFAFFGTLIYMAIKTYRCVTSGEEISLESESLIIDALKWCLGAFALYVLGGKGFTVMNNKANGESPVKPQKTPARKPAENLIEDDGPSDEEYGPQP